MYGGSTDDHWREMRVGKELSNSGILCLPCHYLGRQSHHCFSPSLRGMEKEKVKLADAEFLFQDKWRGLLSWVYLATIDVVS